MKINVQLEIKKFDGEPVMIDQEPEYIENADGGRQPVFVNGAPKMSKGTALTFERAAREALMSDIDDLDKGKPAGKKVERASLAERMYEQTEPVELIDTEATMILDRISKVWVGALVTYRIDSMITEAKAAVLKSSKAAANGEAKDKAKAVEASP